MWRLGSLLSAGGCAAVLPPRRSAVVFSSAPAVEKGLVVGQYCCAFCAACGGLWPFPLRCCGLQVALSAFGYCAATPLRTLVL